jgi:pyrroline-5-carboxylate reductase
MTTTRKNIGFIGAGNMAKAMITGLIQGGFPNAQLWVSNPETGALDFLKITHQVHTTQNNSELANHADVLIFAVKPDVLKSVVLELQPLIFEKKPLFISIAAGISTESIYHWLGDAQHKIQLIRAMPNTPALINQAITGVFSPNALSKTDLNLTETILSAIGSYVWLTQENWLDIVTGLSGSGPAFIFYILEAMISQAVNMGLPESIAKELMLKTCLGSASLALKTNQNLALLRQNVTSKGGTTFAGLQTAESLGLAQTIQNMIAAAVERAKEISQHSL